MGRVPRKIGVPSADRGIVPMLATTSIDGYNIVFHNFSLKFSLEIFGCYSATDRLLRQVSDVRFSYQLVRWDRSMPIPSRMKCLGASTWVPVCEPMMSLVGFTPTFSRVA